MSRLQALPDDFIAKLAAPERPAEAPHAVEAPHHLAINAGKATQMTIDRAGERNAVDGADRSESMVGRVHSGASAWSAGGYYRIWIEYKPDNQYFGYGFSFQKEHSCEQ